MIRSKVVRVGEATAVLTPGDDVPPARAGRSARTGRSVRTARTDQVPSPAAP